MITITIITRIMMIMIMIRIMIMITIMIMIMKSTYTQCNVNDVNRYSGYYVWYRCESVAISERRGGNLASL